MNSRRIMVIPFGSVGDVHPFVGVALALQRRGHDISVMANPHFEPLLDRVGLRLVPIGTAEEYRTVLEHPDLWHPRRGFRVLAGELQRHGARTLRLLQSPAGAGTPLLVAPGAVFGARIAHEALGFPLVTMHLQPTSLVSAYDTAVPHVQLRSINRWPVPLKHCFLTAVDWLSDRALAPSANALRSSLGLAPVRHILREWWHSPQRVIGLFPDWYAPVQPDWPTQTRLTGFPMPDEADAAPTPSLDAWLSEADAAGDRPVVFVAGSNNLQASEFFRAAAEACRRLGRRGLLLTRFVEQVPSRLPPGVRHAEYAPFARVLPLAAAMVHHGGIGTAAQAMRAGCPQLVMPIAFDQPDNAARLERLGVARTLPPAAFTGRNAALEVKALIGSDAVAHACHTAARRFDGVDPVTRTCELIEAALPDG